MKARFPAVILCAVAMAAFFLGGFLSGLEKVFLDDGVYTSIMDSLDVYDDVGISREEQILINRDLADYLAGRRDDLNRTVTLNGEIVPSPFNQREIRHMADVKRLFRTGIAIYTVTSVAGILFLVASLLFCRRRERRWGVLIWLMVMIVLAGAAVLLMTSDFNALFMAFHRLAFNNDLWLLDPATDAMIRMLPEAFFETIALRGVVIGAVAALGSSLFAALLLIFIPDRKHAERKTRS